MMQHLGDITKLDGATIEPVWCVTGGSPCQDLSIAGKRAGLAGARSGLFMEQIRVIKEMREHDKRLGRAGELICPRYMVWENVVGAFSSNKGKDFAAVLEEIIKIVKPEAPGIEVPEKGWPTWGGYHDEVGGRWSVAWRTHDAQYWGVPQRRRRISVVADFGGDTAHEILFDRKSVSGDIAESGAAGEGFAEAAERGFNPAVARSLTARADGSPCADRGPNIVCSPHQGGCDGGGKGALVQTEKSGTLGTGNDQTIFTPTPINLMVATRCKSLGRGTGFGVGEPGDPANTISAAHSRGVFATVIPINDKATRWQGGGESRNHDGSGNGLGIGKEGDPSPTLTAGDRHGVMCMTPWDAQSQRVYDGNGVSPTLSSRENSGLNREAVLCAGFKAGQGAVVCEDVSHALRANAGCAYREDAETYLVQNMVVRRLTPLECERLQGFPDGWTDIGDYTDSTGKKRKTSDSARYKALGNSIALPFWRWMFGRMADYLPEGATLGSLFDGIGGFPLCWENIHGAGTAIWASEIEEFPIAVTKLRFGGAIT